MGFAFQIGSHTAQAELKLIFTLSAKMALKSCFPCLHLLSTGTIAVHHHTWFKQSRDQRQDFVHTRQACHQLSYTASPSFQSKQKEKPAEDRGTQLSSGRMWLSCSSHSGSARCIACGAIHFPYNDYFCFKV